MKRLSLLLAALPLTALVSCAQEYHRTRGDYYDRHAVPAAERIEPWRHDREWHRERDWDGDHDRY